MGLWSIGLPENWYRINNKFSFNLCDWKILDYVQIQITFLFSLLCNTLGPIYTNAFSKISVSSQQKQSKIFSATLAFLYAFDLSTLKCLKTMKPLGLTHIEQGSATQPKNFSFHSSGIYYHISFPNLPHQTLVLPGLIQNLFHTSYGVSFDFIMILVFRNKISILMIAILLKLTATLSKAWKQ